MSLKNVNIYSRTLSIISLIIFIVIIYFLSYLYASKQIPNPFETNCTQPEHKDFTISNAIGNGNKYSIIPLTIIMIVLVSILIYMRKGLYYKLRLCIFIIIGLLFISLTYINPYYLCNKRQKTLHFILAAFAFSLNLLFIGISCYALKNENTKWYRSPIYIIFLVNFILLILCFSLVLSEQKKEDKLHWNVAGRLGNLFAITENLQLIITMTIIVALGFYTPI